MAEGTGNAKSSHHREFLADLGGHSWLDEIECDADDRGFTRRHFIR
jgi:hypothetical protein